MSKGRRGWRQAAQRLRRRLRGIARRQAGRFYSLKANISIAGLDAPGADADYDVHVACRDQLDEDGRRQPHDPNGKMDDDYQYLDIDGFLTAVRLRLAARGRTFGFDHPWAVKHRSDTLIALQTAIAGKLT